jgi:hypothetical protein
VSHTRYAEEPTRENQPLKKKKNKKNQEKKFKAKWKKQILGFLQNETRKTKK